MSPFQFHWLFLLPLLVGCTQFSPSEYPQRPVTGAVDSLDIDDEALFRMIDESGFSGVLAIIEDGEILYVSAHGFEDRAAQSRNTPDTRFELASLGKLFTAVAIHQLVEDGQLELTDTVGQVLPSYPNSIVREHVTILQLLKMQSGLGDIFGKTCDDERARLVTHSDYLCLFEEEPLEFMPGSETRYSNAGYILLGRIVEVVSGQDFYDYIETKIFIPTGMDATGYDYVDGPKQGRAIGYQYEGIDGIAEDIDDVSDRPLVSNGAKGRGTAAGGGFSDVRDFAAFDRALRSETLISLEALGLIFSPEFVRGERSAGFAGGAPGVSTRYRLRFDGLSLIAFGNTDLPSARTVVQLVEDQID